ncbi:MAG: hypothetical protein HUU08_11845 [Candidatus Brocadia sp.]|nr:hypothetical protein [Candidatus Brocadia sp.]
MLKSFFAEKEIKNRLSNVLKTDPHIFDLLLEKIEFNKYLRFKKTLRQLLRKILAMGIKEYLKSLSSKELVNRINIPSSKKKIIFVTGLPTFNLAGISIYLRKTGKFETVLLTENPWLIGFFKQHFDTVYVYNSYYDVAHILVTSKPYIVHIQGSLHHYFLGVIAKCLDRTSMIIGFNDIPSLTELPEENREKLWGISNDAHLDYFSEEFLFKRADGIILTMNTFVAGDKLRLRHESTIPLLEFPTYVCDEFLSEEEKYSRKDGNIHLVYGGIITSSDKPRELFGDNQFIALAKKLINQGLCFHMYPSPHFSPFQIKKLYQDYIQLAAETPKFTFEQGMPQDKAIKEFSRYDFATMMSIFDGMKLNTFHWNTSMPSKFFTYLSAGLPVIVSEEHGNISALVRKYECGIVVSQKDLDNLFDIIKQHDYEKLKTNVRRAREELSMEKHIGRLIEFYERVYNNNG